MVIVVIFSIKVTKFSIKNELTSLATAVILNKEQMNNKVCSVLSEHSMSLVSNSDPMRVKVRSGVTISEPLRERLAEESL